MWRYRLESELHRAPHGDPDQPDNGIHILEGISQDARMRRSG